MGIGKNIHELPATSGIVNTDLIETETTANLNKKTTTLALATFTQRKVQLPPVLIRSELRAIQTIAGDGLEALPNGETITLVGINPGVDEVPNDFLFQPGVSGTDDNLNIIEADDLGGTWFAKITKIATGEIDGTVLEAASATRAGVVTLGAQTLGTGTKTADAFKATNNGVALELGTATEAATPAVTIRSNNTGFAAPSNIGLDSNGDKWVFWNAVGTYKGAIGFNSREMWFQSTDLGGTENQFRFFGGSNSVPVELFAMGDVKGFVFNDTGLAINARFEGDTDANLLFLKGSTDQACICTDTPNGTNKLTVNGGISATSIVTDTLTEKTLGNGVVIPTGIFGKYQTHPTFSVDEQLVDKKYVDDAVSGAVPIPIVNTIYVNKSYTGSTKNGTITNPYTAIMDAVNVIPDAVSGDNDGLKIIYQIFVFAGQYDEAVVVPTLKTPHLIEFIAIGGMVYLGASTGSYFNTPTTPRNFEWRLTKPATFVTPVRPSLSLLAITPESNISTHLAYAKSGWRITGNLLLGDISPDFNVSSTEFHFENVVVDGNIGLTGDSGSMGNTNIILYGCRFGNFDFAYTGSPSATVNLNMVKDCNFNGSTFRVATIANLINCNLDNGFTINAVNTFFQPSPIIVNTKIAGTLTAASAQTIYIDTISSQLSGTIATSNVTLVTSSNINISAPTLQSTVTTGTAPFTVASTTVVTNLNADLLDGNSSLDLVPLTTKGDILSFSTVNAALAVGTTGQILSVDLTTPTGLKWIDNAPFTNPMSALGDMIYGGTAGALTRLIGNTTTTKKYLQSVGDGTLATAPSWQQVSYNDLSDTPTIPVQYWQKVSNVVAPVTISDVLAIGTTTQALLSSLTLSHSTNHKITIQSTNAGEVNAIKFENTGNTSAPFIEAQFVPLDTAWESYLSFNYAQGASIALDFFKLQGNKVTSAVPFVLTTATDALMTMQTTGDDSVFRYLQYKFKTTIYDGSVVDRDHDPWMIGIEQNTAVGHALDRLHLGRENYQDLIIWRDGSVLVAGSFTAGHINLNANTISSTDSNGNINLSPNGAGKIYANNPFLSKINVISKTANYTVQGNESGSIFNNEGATGSITLTLPTPGSITGHWYRFEQTAGYLLSINDGTNTYGSSDDGAAITFYYDGTSWNYVIEDGMWSVSNVPVNAALTYKSKIVIHGSGTARTITASETNTFFGLDPTSSVDVEFNLPAPVNGLRYTFYQLQSSPTHYIRINATNTTTIKGFETTEEGVSDGYIRSNVRGAALTLVCYDSTWRIESMRGTWTFDA